MISGSRDVSPAACLNPAYRGKYFFQIRTAGSEAEKSCVLFFFFNVIILEYEFALEQYNNLMLTSPAANITTHDSAYYI